MGTRGGLYVAVLILLCVPASAFFDAITGADAIDLPTCIDTDGGQDRYIMGTVELGTSRISDYCASDGVLKEYYCDGHTLGVLQVQCKFGCDDGACNEYPLTVGYTCLDTDGGDAEIRGLCVFSDASGNHSFEDCCASECAVGSAAARTLYEYGCEEITSGFKACQPREIDCEFGCSAGACVPTPTCSDSDGGKSYSVPGVVTFGSDRYQDTCTYFVDKGVFMIEEHYCSGGLAKTERYECPAFCDAGACVDEPGSCTDTDGGKVPFVRGTVSSDGTQGTDQCAGYSETTLIEHFCSGGVPTSETVICEHGCSNGECTGAEQTCDEGWQCLSHLTSAYRTSSCRWENFTICAEGCENGRCLQSTLNYEELYLDFDGSPVSELGMGPMKTGGAYSEDSRSGMSIGDFTNDALEYQCSLVFNPSEGGISIWVKPEGNGIIFTTDDASLSLEYLNGIVLNSKLDTLISYKEISGWHQINLVWSADSIEMFVDGVSAGDARLTLNACTTFRIGNNYAGWKGFGGYLDDFRLSPTQLETVEVPEEEVGGCDLTTQTRSPDPQWDTTSPHPEIVRYRVKWFNGEWSRWYTPRVDDEDWQVFEDGSKRKVWSYFTDHTHEVQTCSLDSRCSDSDGGLAYGIKGTADTEFGSYQDYCEGNLLIEQVCQGSSHSHVSYPCPGSCVEGRCLQSDVDTCADSDGGLNFSVRGSCIDGTSTYADFCQTPLALDEYYCFNGACKAKSAILCPIGTECVDGRCAETGCMCDAVYQPVCAGGNTYANRCLAACAGVTVDHEGKCGRSVCGDGLCASGEEDTCVRDCACKDTLVLDDIGAFSFIKSSSYDDILESFKVDVCEAEYQDGSRLKARVIEFQTRADAEIVFSGQMRGVYPQRIELGGYSVLLVNGKATWISGVHVVLLSLETAAAPTASVIASDSLTRLEQIRTRVQGVGGFYDTNIRKVLLSYLRLFPPDMDDCGDGTCDEGEHETCPSDCAVPNECPQIENDETARESCIRGGGMWVTNDLVGGCPVPPYCLLEDEPMTDMKRLALIMKLEDIKVKVMTLRQKSEALASYYTLQGMGDKAGVWASARDDFSDLIDLITEAEVAVKMEQEEELRDSLSKTMEEIRQSLSQTISEIIEGLV